MPDPRPTPMVPSEGSLANAGGPSWRFPAVLAEIVRYLDAMPKSTSVGSPFHSMMTRSFAYWHFSPKIASVPGNSAVASDDAPGSSFSTVRFAFPQTLPLASNSVTATSHVMIGALDVLVKRIFAAPFTPCRPTSPTCSAVRVALGSGGGLGVVGLSSKCHAQAHPSAIYGVRRQIASR